MADIKKMHNTQYGEAARVTFTLRERVEKERKVIEILEDIEGKDVFLRDAVVAFAESEHFKKHRANMYDGPGHRKRTTE